MSDILDDYGNPLDMGTIAPPETVAAPFPGLDTDPNTNPNTSTGVNSPFKAGDVFKNPLVSDLSGISGIAKALFTDKNGNLNLQALGALGGGLAGLMGAMNPTKNPTGYQGSIPNLSATRTMLTAPPTTNPDGSPRRPGQSGINYGGDVTYTRMPAGTDPWANLSGTSGGVKGGVGTVGGTAGSTTPITKITGGGDGTNTANLGSEGYQLAMKAGLTPAQYLNNINQWIIDHPFASKDQIAAAMKQFKVSDADLQEALRTTTFSDATKYALTHGSGLAELNNNITNWLQAHPYATNAQIQAEQAKYGVNDEDVARSMTGLNSSAAKEYAVVHDMGLDQLYKNILDYQAAGHTPAEIAAAMAATGVEQRDINAANKFATEQGYTANPTSAAAIQNFLNTEVPKNEDVNKGLTNLGLITPPKVESTDMYQPVDNTDYSYMQAAEGGYLKYAGGGDIPMAKGRYLQGETDGMADELPARIGKDQPAALSHGEFVVPADVVSHLGNGNSDAGAKKLYQMMDKIRMARTGTKKQGKEINPDKFMPGGLATAKFAGGGDVSGSALNAGLTGTESSLSNWVGPYTTNMLGQGMALANMPYQAYTGPLTAGASQLQTGAFKTASGLTTPTALGDAATQAGNISTAAQGLSYSPTTTTFGKDQAAAYMNPYLESALKPQLEEARRQSQITQQQNAAKMTQAGAFGGGRQAILDAETQRSLGANLANITGQGYSTAFDKAMAQFNADQARKAQEAQFGATYGLQGLQTGLQAAQAQGALGAQQNQVGLANLAAQMEAGKTQRDIESEGIAADKAQFEEARANPYKMVQFQQSLLSGLPLAAQTYNVAQPSTLQQILSGAGGVAGLFPNAGTTGAQDLAAALKKLGIG